MHALLNDMIAGLRRLAAQPGTSLVIVLTLAFGIGVNTAIFSLVNGVVLRDLPFERGAEIVEIRQQALPAGVDNVGASVAEVQDYREQNSTLEAVVEFHFMWFFVDAPTPALVKAGVVSADFFDFLGVRPALGRGFIAADDVPGAAPVIVLSQAFWRRHYGSDSAIIGSTIEMNGRAHEVIGVLPDMPHFPEVNDVYLPTSGCRTRSNPDFVHNRGARMMRIYARAKPGVDIAQAASDVDLIAARMRAAHPELYPPEIGFEAKLVSLQEEMSRDIRPALQLLFAASLLLFLITCANVVNLTLARHTSRQKEIAVRMALGAGRGHIARRLLAESMLLALAGGAGALLIAAVGLDLLAAFAAGYTDRAGEVALDGQALAFNLLLTLLVGVVAGMAPLFGRQALQQGLGAGDVRTTAVRRQNVTRRSLVVAQIAIAFMLVSSAGLMIRGFVALQAVDPGYRSDGITALTMPLNWSRYGSDETVRGFVRALEAELAELPGVDGLAYANGYPFGRGVGIAFGDATLNFDDRNDASLADDRGKFRVVSPSYFDLLDIPLAAGRAFTAGDDETAPKVAVLGEAMAQRFWPDRSALGQRFSVDGGETWLSVVGVVRNVRDASLDGPLAHTFYLPFAQMPMQSLNVLVASAMDPAVVAAQVREVVTRIDPAQPISSTTTLTRAIDDSLGAPRLLSQVLGMFSLLALAIALVGVSSLLAYTVSQRRRELGIRMALGAAPTRVRRLVLRQGGLLVIVGLAAGLAGSLALARLADGLLQGTMSSDPTPHLLVALMFLLVSLAACWIPAARASRFDPVDALRGS
jgi:putative ABC transport system permease protein